jgi:1,4-dihydroxy-2-naphthoyl-CoA synthase
MKVDSDNSADLAIELRGPVAVITMLGKDRLNAQRRTFWPALREALSAAEANNEVAVIVLTGEGDKAFSAGGDIIGYKQLTTTDSRRDFIVDCMRTFEAVETCTKPVIAAVNGIAAGGGCELASACDIVIASSKARFAVPEARLGLVPGFGVSIADAVKASCSAYPFFERTIVRTSMGEDIELIDGGYCANNPTLYAIADAVQALKRERKMRDAIVEGADSVNALALESF